MSDRKENINFNLYEDIKQQAQSNMDSAIGFIQTYDYYTRPQPVYLDNLCRQGDELVRKFNILVEKMVDIDTNLCLLYTSPSPRDTR